MNRILLVLVLIMICRPSLFAGGHVFDLNVPIGEKLCYVTKGDHIYIVYDQTRKHYVKVFKINRKGTITAFEMRERAFNRNCTAGYGYPYNINKTISLAGTQIQYRRSEQHSSPTEDLYIKVQEGTKTQYYRCTAHTDNARVIFQGEHFAIILAHGEIDSTVVVVGTADAVAVMRKRIETLVPDQLEYSCLLGTDNNKDGLISEEQYERETNHGLPPQ